LEYRPLEAMKPSLLAFKPSLTYTLIGPWCRLTSKMFLITFFKLLFLENYVMLEGLCKHCPFYQVVLWCSCFSLLLTWATCGRGHHYWIIFKHEARWPPKTSFIWVDPLLNSSRDHHANP
jgi:hypothetical protein